MAQTPADQKQAYPLPVYNYRVTVDGEAMSFSEVAGLGVEYDTVTYRHGLSYSEGERIQTFDFDVFSPVTLKRGIVPGAGPLALYQWMKAREERSVEVSLCDETGTPVLTWRIDRAVAVQLEAPTFDASSNEVAIESLELRARAVSIVAP
jgi:phage tail-like protein